VRSLRRFEFVPLCQTLDLNSAWLKRTEAPA
jgi:hypothetical protein